MHKASTKIISQFDCIVVENLNLQGMTKRAKEVNVKQKTGLNRSLLVPMLRDKSQPCLHLSSRCFGSSSCGCISPDNRKSQAKFQCVECDFETNADVNAAKNIKGRYYPLLPEASG